MVGRQTPLLALFVPLILVGMVDGWRGVKAVWPAALVGGVSFAIGQFACSNYISVELTDIVASLLSVGRDGRVPARLAAGRRRWWPRRGARGGPAIAGAADRRRRARGGGAPPRGQRAGLARATSSAPTRRT